MRALDRLEGRPAAVPVVALVLVFLALGIVAAALGYVAFRMEGLLREQADRAAEDECARTLNNRYDLYFALRTDVALNAASGEGEVYTPSIVEAVESREDLPPLPAPQDLPGLLVIAAQDKLAVNVLCSAETEFTPPERPSG